MVVVGARGGMVKVCGLGLTLVRGCGMVVVVEHRRMCDEGMQ